MPQRRAQGRSVGGGGGRSVVREEESFLFHVVLHSSIRGWAGNRLSYGVGSRHDRKRRF